MAQELIDPLTPREEGVLDLLRRGFTNAQLADELGISENTAKDHVSSILRKLGARSRDEAAYWPQTAPWWARAPLIAPVALFLRRSAQRLPLSPSMATNVLAGTALVAVVAGLSLLALLLLRTDGGEEAPQGRWLSLLAQIPDTEESRLAVTMNDYAQVRDLFGVARPALDAGEQELIDYYVELFTESRGSWPSDLLGNLRMPDAFTELRTEFGFTIADVDIDAIAGDEMVDPNSLAFQIVRGRISEARVLGALRTDPTFSDILEKNSYNGADYYHWGREGVDVTRITAVRPLGEAGHLVISEDTVYWTKRTAQIEAMIDARRGDEPSLADSKNYRLLAGALDALDTYSAYFSSETAVLTVSAWEEWATPEQIASESVLMPFIAYATGTGRDAGGDYFGIVLVHEGPDVAAENANRLQRRLDGSAQTAIFDLTRQDPPSWRDVTGDIRIDVQDRLVVAKIYIVSEEMPSFRWLFRGSLLIHE